MSRKKTKTESLTFYRRLKIGLALMGVLPFLMTMYLVTTEIGKVSQLMVIGSAIILFSMLIGFTFLRRYTDQLTALAHDTSQVGSGESLAPLQVKAGGEVADIAGNFNVLVDQLNQANRDVQDRSVQLQEFAKSLSESYELLERDTRLRNHLSRYVGKDFVEKLVNSQDGRLLKDERRIVTIMFADIRYFTAISEQMEPEEVLAMLNEYFSVMVEIVFKYDGMLDKLVGDQIMAVFGHSSSEARGAKAAVRAAFEMNNATAILMKKRAKLGKPVFRIGIGINTGTAILGSVGSKHRKDYTVIGDTVNTGARLEKEAGEREVVVGERTFKHLPSSIHVGSRQLVHMKNRTEPLLCYTLVPERRSVSRKKRKMAVTGKTEREPSFTGTPAGAAG